MADEILGPKGRRRNPIPITRVCRVCGTEKPFEEFKIVNRHWRLWTCKLCYDRQVREQGRLAREAARPIREAAMAAHKAAAFEVTEKRCTWCDETKPIEQFHHHHKSPGGRRAHCKACRKMQAAARYQQNRDTILAQTNAWRAANRDKVSTAVRRRRAKDPKKFDEAAASWARAHPEKRREWSLASYYRHRPKRLQGMRLYQATHKDTIRVQRREYEARNHEHLAALKREYKARKRGAQGKHTGNDIARIRKQQRDRCAMPDCRKPLKGKGHVDHRVALSNGGSNDPANLQLLCAKCNMSKKNKDELAFLRERGFLI